MPILPQALPSTCPLFLGHKSQRAVLTHTYTHSIIDFNFSTVFLVEFSNHLRVKQTWPRELKGCLKASKLCPLKPTAAVLKLGFATLLRVAKFQKKVAKLRNLEKKLCLFV